MSTASNALEQIIMHDGCPRLSTHSRSLFYCLSSPPSPGIGKKAGKDVLLYYIRLPQVLVHCSPPLQVYSAAAADLALFKRMRKFIKVHKKLAEVGETVLQRHTWYLTEELLPLCLFSPNPPETLDNIATRISSLPDSDHPLQKPVLPRILPNSSLADFFGARSTVLFKILNVPHSFLSSPDWRSSPEFMKIKEAVSNLSPLNDCCERALALATTFNGTMTNDEASYQELMLVVESHRKKFKLSKKDDLKNLF